MRRRWGLLLVPLVLLVPLLLLGGWMIVSGLRFTPEAVVRSLPQVRGEVVQSAEFPGGVALLLASDGRYQAHALCRDALILWRHCGGADFPVTDDTDETEALMVESASWSAIGNEGWGVSVFAGVAIDERIARIVWEGQEVALAEGARHYLFARRTQAAAMFPPAYALASTGRPLYEWGEETTHDWQPALPSEPVFPSSPGPATWYVPLPPEEGNWGVRRADPLEAVRLFVIGADGEVGDSVSYRVVKANDEQRTYLARMEGLKDDSIRSIEYLVRLEHTGGEWQVTDAAYRTECRRGASPEGLCS